MQARHAGAVVQPLRRPLEEDSWKTPPQSNRADGAGRCEPPAMLLGARIRGRGLFGGAVCLSHVLGDGVGRRVCGAAFCDGAWWAGCVRCWAAVAPPRHRRSLAAAMKLMSVGSFPRGSFWEGLGALSWVASQICAPGGSAQGFTSVCRPQVEPNSCRRSPWRRAMDAISGLLAAQRAGCTDVRRA